MQLSPLDRALSAARRGHHEAARRLLDDVLASDSMNEEALLWRARVADNAADKRRLLMQALAVNPDNRWATDELATIESSGLGDEQPVSDTLSCINCGGSVDVHPERGTKAAVCTYCGSVLELTGGQMDIIGQMDPKVRPAQPIAPGHEATFFGENHLVMGWLQYEGWDDEDRWRWDEWQLVSDSGVPRYLSFSSDEGWTIQTPIRPTPKIGMMWIDTPDGKAIIKERGPARIMAMRGEFTWRPGLNRTLQVIEAKTGKTHVSAETTADELEVVGGPRISERELWEAFGREDKLKEMDERIERQKKRRRALRLAALLCFAASGVYFVASGWAANKGQTIYTSSEEFIAQERDLPIPESPPATELDSRATGVESIIRERAIVGTFTVEDPGETHEAQIQALVPQELGGRPEAEIYIEEPDGTLRVLTSALATTISDGMQATVAFKPEKRGDHTLIANVESTSPERFTFSTTIRTGMWAFESFGIASLVAGLLGIVLFLGGGFGRIK
ncbi:MAG: hypothetical protein Rubg2KO_32190 [Rubricoccaceae bacterium]